ncbi:hypothetical protein RJT34_32138 [Clitoria ternatea]|uniref:Uncharacterized protein n=1 Tax=Clitoria ternatea TaxID=43366 RepID=A0AAN9EWU9_CLITE
MILLASLLQFYVRSKMSYMLITGMKIVSLVENAFEFWLNTGTNVSLSEKSFDGQIAMEISYRCLSFAVKVFTV